MQFALHVAKHVSLLKSTRSGQPQLPEVLPAATKTFQSMRYGVEAELWSFVKFEDVFVYLRGSKSLEIPNEWKELIPKAFPVPE